MQTSSWYRTRKPQYVTIGNFGFFRKVNSKSVLGIIRLNIWHCILCITILLLISQCNSSFFNTTPKSNFRDTTWNVLQWMEQKKIFSLLVFSSKHIWTISFYYFHKKLEKHKFFWIFFGNWINSFCFKSLFFKGSNFFWQSWTSTWENKRGFWGWNKNESNWLSNMMKKSRRQELIQDITLQKK